MTNRHRNAVTGHFASAADAEAAPDQHVAETVRERVTFSPERMNGGMLKLHVAGAGRPMVLHVFTAPDRGDPHDHAQWGFWSTVLDGSYLEEAFAPDGTSQIIERRAGDRFRVEADHVHRIIDLPSGMCVTLIEPDPHTGRDSGFYDFRDDGVWHRLWHEAEFAPLKRGVA